MATASKTPAAKNTQTSKDTNKKAEEVTKQKGATATASGGKGKGGKGKSAEREVIHPDVKVVVHREELGNALTADKAMKILGWTEESEDESFGANFMMKDENKNKIRCVNNTGNRPFDEAWCLQLAQDILNKHYAFNGETVVIGKTGRVLSGQHRLPALVIAKQRWDNDEKWRDKWPEEPTIDTLVVYGVEETPFVTRTLDNTKTRTFADALFADTAIFAKYKEKKQRLTLVRMVDYCVSFLWERLWLKKDAWEPRKSNATALEFMARHPHVVQAVQHIAEENAGESNDANRIGKYISPGIAAGLLYLMGASNSDNVDYHKADSKKEGSGKKALINWDNWEKACEFWMLFASGDKELKGVHEALKALVNENTGRQGSRNEKVAVFIKAFNLFLQGKKVTANALKLNYVEKENGAIVLDDYPECTVADGKGLDRGKQTAEKPEEDEPEEDDVAESIEEAKERVKAESLAAKKAGKGKGKKAQEPVEEEEEEEGSDEPGEGDDEDDADEDADVEEEEEEGEEDLPEEEGADDDESDDEDEDE